MIQMAVIADDLTGANDTAIQFVKQGLRTLVLMHSQPQRRLAEMAGAVVLNTESRALEPADAYQRVRSVMLMLQAHQVQRVYKKVDSTLRGNLGVEIQAIDEVTAPDLTVIAPAFPKNRRTTLGGIQLVNHQPVSQSEAGSESQAPVLESYLPALLRRQTNAAVGLVPLLTVRAGKAAILKAITERLAQGERWLIFDAASSADLQQIAAAAATYHHVLWVGSAGLAETLPPLFFPQQAPAAVVLPPAEGPVLVVSGSIHQTTRSQIHQLLLDRDVQRIPVDAVRLLSNPAHEVQRCIDLAHACMSAYPLAVVIASAYEAEAANAACADGLRLGLSAVEISRRISEALGRIAAGLAGQRLGGLILTGGDTASAVCHALEVDSMQVCEEIAPGIPLGVMAGERCGTLRVVTKAGGFGDKQALVKALKAIKKGCHA